MGVGAGTSAIFTGSFWMEGVQLRGCIVNVRIARGGEDPQIRVALINTLICKHPSLSTRLRKARCAFLLGDAFNPSNGQQSKTVERTCIGSTHRM